MKDAKEQYLTYDKGDRIAVVIPIKNYEKMQEDLHDLSIIAERKNEMLISLDEMENQLKQNGKISN